MEPIVDRERYVFHGLSGKNGQVKRSQEETIKSAIIDEIADLDPYYDKSRNMIMGQNSFSIVRLVKNIYSTSTLFGLYRLIRILKIHQIETLEDVKNKPGALIINSGENLGDFNHQDELCFSTPNKTSINGMSCDYGGSWALFIEQAVGIVLPYDEVFGGYNKSDNYNGIFEDEIRIKGSIDNPNIYAISLPVTSEVGNEKDKTSRLRSLEYWKTNISIVKAILEKLGYPDVHIVDSMSGYNLEDTEVIQGFKAVIEGREGIKESINYINWSHDSMTFLKALKQYAMQLNNNNKAKDEEISL